MNNVVVFPTPVAHEERFQELGLVGAESGMTVRLIERLDWPNDLLVVLGGTFEGSSTVAAVPAGEIGIAEVIGHAVLASLRAAELTRSRQKTAS